MSITPKSERLIQAHTMLMHGIKIGIESAFETLQEKQDIPKEINNFRMYSQKEVNETPDSGEGKGERLMQAQLGGVLAGFESLAELMSGPHSVHPRITGTLIAGITETILVARSIINGTDDAPIKEILDSLRETMESMRVADEERKEDNTGQRNPL